LFKFKGKMTKKQRAELVQTELEKLYPQVPIPLDHTDPYTLMVAVALSAQTTDKKVNQVTQTFRGRRNSTKNGKAGRVSDQRIN
jgi:endonuclease-3